MIPGSEDSADNEARWVRNNPLVRPGSRIKLTNIVDVVQRAILSSTPTAALKDKKFKKLLRAGAPSNLRGEVWTFFAGTQARRQAGQFEKLLQDAEATEEMEKDVQRSVLFYLRLAFENEL